MTIVERTPRGGGGQLRFQRRRHCRAKAGGRFSGRKTTMKSMWSIPNFSAWPSRSRWSSSFCRFRPSKQEDEAKREDRRLTWPSISANRRPTNCWGTAAANVYVQIYSALLETSTSEHAARMMAMDNATKACNDMIDNLTLLTTRPGRPPLRRPDGYRRRRRSPQRLKTYRYSYRRFLDGREHW